MIPSSVSLITLLLITLALIILVGGNCLAPGSTDRFAPFRPILRGALATSANSQTPVMPDGKFMISALAH
jgi:hypothetical protein